ncbi:MAG: hypothetical protein OXQ28_04165 [Acidobacteriota bacterium]|nr:hypothetical protein [Acidobacteriota bacterium]
MSISWWSLTPRLRRMSFVSGGGTHVPAGVELGTGFTTNTNDNF